METVVACAWGEEVACAWVVAVAQQEHALRLGLEELDDVNVAFAKVAPPPPHTHTHTGLVLSFPPISCRRGKKREKTLQKLCQGASWKNYVGCDPVFGWTFSRTFDNPCSMH